MDAAHAGPILALQFAAEGRYRDALDALPAAPARATRLDSEVLRAELFEKTGELAAAKESARRLLRTRGASESQMARCEFVLSRVAGEGGEFRAELQHLQRAISLAGAANDLETKCWSQLRLSALIADREGPGSVASLLADLRGNVIKLGQPSITAALHLFVAEQSGKRGALDNARRHTRIAENILKENPHVWLQAWAENNFLALDVVNSDLLAAERRTAAALRLSHESGVTSAIGRCLGNIGNLRIAQGRFDAAAQSLTEALTYLTPSSEYASAVKESLASIYLAERKFDDCRALLPTWNDQSAVPMGYVQRHSQLTIIRLLEASGLHDRALSALTGAITAASQSGDEYLVGKLNLLSAELSDGTESRIVKFAEAVGRSLQAQPKDLYAQYEKTLALCMSRRGCLTAGPHFSRASQLYSALGNELMSVDLQRRAEKEIDSEPAASDNVGASLQSVAAALRVANPAYTARIVFNLLKAANCVAAASLSRESEDQESRLIVDAFGNPECCPENDTLSFRLTEGESLKITHARAFTIESQATLNAITILIETLKELEQARLEREERLTLWPIEDLPADDEDAVVLGKMRELMSFARKVARTNVSVLITGESGTGKEVLARAIHRYSARADKPFIPVNCTAVPRELLESHLFGHRRGAFTGAERDNLGLIRAAQDGTLFLDEVGELGLDLQPKLLRFLESGEINPLGEPAPFRVNVRILAATNANLETLVQQGAFREDLFYRLNVIRLSIPPLRERRDEIPALVHHLVAKAAAEFGKARVRVSEDAMEHLLLYPWPGNIRQLHNELRRMVALAEPDTVLPASAISAFILRATPRAARGSAGPEISVPLQDKLTPTLNRIEREMIKVALRAHQGKVDAAAKALGISRKGLYLKRQRLGL